MINLICSWGCIPLNWNSAKMDYDIKELESKLDEFKEIIDKKKFAKWKDLEEEIQHQFKSLGDYYLDDRIEKKAASIFSTVARRDVLIKKYCSENKDQLKGNKDTINKIRRSIVAPSLYK
ncbi:hypothetical protein [Candidatus Neptunochlamydia vexilliferae]|uniref:Uncharacterized protein n=1 Tax=Candidatus Neptunichlamydia vexilliferae TaxID=1651774 RepID=A0ABS0AZW5_9BACT|nr:hypothetical protein [Candidatus Neptunochlamydia vexilliferae]MBF5059652.1 hypothetical protein [Candidatus Neptunochlamydia vexilliferae]